jgi:polyisoprenoid-binding protein YceI
MSTRPWLRGFPMWGVVAGVLLLGLPGCQTSPPREPMPAPAPPPVERPGVPVGAHEYKVIAEESLLQILVYRGGAMARLGHNHVIASHHLEGEVQLTQDLVDTRFEIRVPVNELTVDEPAMREMAGADFPPGVPQSARDGTRKNLLSEALLDGANYPVIRLRGVQALVGADPLNVDVEISIKDHVRRVRVPVQLERQDGVLHARGEFPLKQSDLGLKPFSVAMGTLVVLDDMKIRFDITAKMGSLPIS